MALYTADSRDRVRDAVDMIELVSTKVELRRQSANRYVGLCPFHDERTGSFGVDPMQKVYHCFGCQASGDIFTFVQETEGVDFRSALELLAERFGVELKLEHEDPGEAKRRERRERLLKLLDWAATGWQKILENAPEAAEARKHLADRKLDPVVLAEVRAGYAPADFQRLTTAALKAGWTEEELLATGLSSRSQRNPKELYDRFRDRIIFPLCDMRGRILGFGGRALHPSEKAPKYVNTSDGEVYHKGQHVYGAHLARAAAAKAGEVILCEGYTDVIAMRQAGLGNTVGLMGTALTEQQVTELARMAQRVILCLDADAAGQDAMLRAAGHARAKKLELRVAKLPDGLDPAELMHKRGSDALKEAAGATVHFDRFQVETILERADTTTPEGKDAAIAAMRPVLARAPASVTREDLVKLAAERLDLEHTFLAGLLGGPRQAQPTARRTPPSGAPPADRTVAGRAHARANAAARAERALLSLCVAHPRDGRAVLENIDAESLFADEGARRACMHLREHLEDPTAGTDEDPELAALIAGIVLGGDGEPGGSGEIETQLLQVKIAAVDRLIRATERGGRTIRELADERQQLRDALDRAVDRSAS